MFQKKKCRVVTSTSAKQYLDAPLQEASVEKEHVLGGEEGEDETYFCSKEVLTPDPGNPVFQCRQSAGVT